MYVLGDVQSQAVLNFRFQSYTERHYISIETPSPSLLPNVRCHDKHEVKAPMPLRTNFVRTSKHSSGIRNGKRVKEPQREACPHLPTEPIPILHRTTERTEPNAELPNFSRAAWRRRRPSSASQGMIRREITDVCDIASNRHINLDRRSSTEAARWAEHTYVRTVLLLGKQVARGHDSRASISGGWLWYGGYCMY